VTIVLPQSPKDKHS